MLAYQTSVFGQGAPAVSGAAVARVDLDPVDRDESVAAHLVEFERRTAAVHEHEDHDDDMGFRCVWEPLAERPAEPAAE